MTGLVSQDKNYGSLVLCGWGLLKAKSNPSVHQCIYSSGDSILVMTRTGGLALNISFLAGQRLTIGAAGYFQSLIKVYERNDMTNLEY